MISIEALPTRGENGFNLGNVRVRCRHPEIKGDRLRIRAPPRRKEPHQPDDSRERGNTRGKAFCIINS